MGARNVVVTGGAQGIGRAVAEAFSRLGDHVYAIDRDAEALAELPQGIVALRADMGSVGEVETACREIVAQAGSVHIVINNAGVGGEWNGVLETPVEEWDRVLNVNLRAYWLTAKFLVPAMPPGGSFVNIASTRALMSEPNSEPYSASKGGVVALTHSLAISLAERRIRVNCISPGWIETSEYQKNSRKTTADLSPSAHEQHPAGRVGTPQDIAEACVYLASAAAGFITGANLVIDGGMTRKMIYEE